MTRTLRASCALAFGFWLLLLLSSCLHHAPRPYYISRPLADSEISVFMDERTLIWLNAGLHEARFDMEEDGVCLHIAKNEGDSVFFVDSLEKALVDVNAMRPNWRHIAFMCPPETAPLHWHVAMPEMSTFFGWIGDNTGFILEHRCEFGPADLTSYWARYDFVAMQCGTGMDSIRVHKIKRRH